MSGLRVGGRAKQAVGKEPEQMGLSGRVDSRRVVMHIITRLDGGGSAMDTVCTVLRHDRRRFRVMLVCGQKEAMSAEESALIDAGLRDLQRAEVPLITIPSMAREINPFRDVRAVWGLWRLMRRERPAIVHTHTSKAGLVGRLAAWLARVPVVIHTPHGHIFYGYYGMLMSKMICWVERILAMPTDRIVTLTDQGAREHIQHKIARPQKFAVIPSGITLSTFRSVRVDRSVKRKELGIPVEGVVVGTVGRLVPVKGHAWLLQSAPRILCEYPQACFVFIGDGPLSNQLRLLADNLGVSASVLFLGVRRDVPECLATFDVFVLPSLNEGMGLALVEAMAMGLPVVASRVGGVPDIVTDGVNGVLVPACDEQALASAVLGLLRDPSQRKAFGESAIRSVNQRFDITSTVEAIENLYDAVWREKVGAI